MERDPNPHFSFTGKWGFFLDCFILNIVFNVGGVDEREE